MEPLLDLWHHAFADPVPLFATLPGSPQVVPFNPKGFYLSKEADDLHRTVRDHPHLYVARLSSGDGIYFGKSNQRGGRWKRSRSYHLRDLALELLAGSRRPGGHTTWPPPGFTRSETIPLRLTSWCDRSSPL